MKCETVSFNKEITGRDIAALLNPRLAILVTCGDASDRPNVLTVAWHTPLSHQPPLVGISIGDSRYSHHLIAETGEFVINIVGDAFKDAVKLCGNCSGTDHNKAILAELHLLPAKTVHTPVIEGALGCLECRVVGQLPMGDHTFFVGEVLHAEAQAHAFSNTWEASGRNVLLCWQRDIFSTGCLEENGHGLR